MKDLLNRITRALSSQRALNIINSSSDIILALFIIMLIMVIIIPVSPNMLDNLIAINLAVSISVLMVALYIPKAVNLSIFPSLLLITTLFRLGIEISATKQILLHGYAGHIIYT
ncbi:MAG: FHIPEP family type III secretion protein, partial [Verrucomicrobiota bacterium]